jgi:hypothetical protein
MPHPRMGKIGQKKPAPVNSQMTTIKVFTSTYAKRWVRNSLFYFSRAIAWSRRVSTGNSCSSVIMTTSISSVSPLQVPAQSRTALVQGTTVLLLRKARATFGSYLGSIGVMMPTLSSSAAAASRHRSSR